MLCAVFFQADTICCLLAIAEKQLTTITQRTIFFVCRFSWSADKLIIIAKDSLDNDIIYKPTNSPSSLRVALLS